MNNKFENMTLSIINDNLSSSILLSKKFSSQITEIMNPVFLLKIYSGINLFLEQLEVLFNPVERIRARFFRILKNPLRKMSKQLARQFISKRVLVQLLQGTFFILLIYNNK